MRSLVLSSLLILFAGCGNGDGASGNDLGTTADLSAPTAPIDLAMATNDDLSMMTGCHGLQACLAGCKGNVACDMACRVNATTEAKRLYRALITCHVSVCDGPPDAGTGPCFAGTPMSTTCKLCISDSNMMSGMCAQGQPSWCGACYSEYAACQTNTP
jgi:hypothetical protein